MAKVITDEQNYYDIADAIRGKLEVETLYLPSEMADAIESIETGTDLTSEDEGKVVIEDDGAYILAEQTSQTITLNGTYDTTTINELIANISGGGTAKNILNGNGMPASAVGSDGDIYLQLGNNIIPIQTYNIEDIGVSITNGVVTIVGTTAGIDTSDGTFSGVTLKTGINLVRISVTPHQNGIQYGTCSSSASLPTVVSTGSGRGSYSSDTNGYDFSKNTDDYYFACAYDNGVGNEVRIEVTSNDQSQQFDADATSINNVYLKVNGAWVLIEGQDISDVNTIANLIEKTVTSNGTYDPTDDDAEGYSLVTVDVPQSGGGECGGPYDVSMDTAIVKNESSVAVTKPDDGISFAWDGGQSIGANAFLPIYIPEGATSIGYKLTTGSSYGTTDPRKLCVGIIPISVGTDSWVFSNSQAWEAVNVHDTNNMPATGFTLDTSQVSGGKLLCISAHGWTATVSDVKVDNGSGGGSQGGGTTITIYDNPTNATGDLMSGDVLYSPDTSGASFVFLFVDNQQTGFTIGGKTYSYNDTVIGTGWNSDNVNAILDELDDSDSLNVAWSGGDGGNHAGTLIVINKSFGTSYKQTMFQSNSASQTIGTTMSEAYVLLLFCVYGGSATANITFMGDSISVQRYATRFSNSIYAYVSKLENLSTGSVVSVSVDGASSSSVIGIMGIFGD